MAHSTASAIVQDSSVFHLTALYHSFEDACSHSQRFHSVPNDHHRCKYDPFLSSEFHFNSRCIPVCGTQYITQQSMSKHLHRVCLQVNSFDDSMRKIHWNNENNASHTSDNITVYDTVRSNDIIFSAKLIVLIGAVRGRKDNRTIVTLEFGTTTINTQILNDGQCTRLARFILCLSFFTCITFSPWWIKRANWNFEWKPKLNWSNFSNNIQSDHIVHSSNNFDTLNSKLSSSN